MSLKIRRGTNSERLTIIPDEGELLYTTDTKKIFVGDGTTTGGTLVTGGLQGNLVDNLYLDNHNIIGHNISINGDNGTISASSVTAHLRGSVYADDSTVLVDSIQGKVVGPIDVDVVNVRIAGGTSGQVLTTNGNGVMSWSNKTNSLVSMASLTDVSLFNLGINDTLKWNGTNWVNSSLSSGHFDGDITGSVFADDSTLLLSGNSKYMSNGTITIQDNTISTIPSVDFINIDKRLALYNLTSTSPIIIKSTPNRSIKFETFVGTFNNPQAVSPGSVLSSFVFTACDGFSQLTGFPGAARISVSVDPNGTVSQGIIPSKIVFNTNSSTNVIHTFSFDSEGRMGVNRSTPSHNLDVDGTARFDGFVQFGSYTTTERDALMPAYGTVIYNTTDNKFQGYQNTGGITPQWVDLS